MPVRVSYPGVYVQEIPSGVRTMLDWLSSHSQYWSDRAQTEIPLADQNTWILYGYVRNRELKGIPNLTVAVYDQRRCLEQLGYACTDQRGYFKLSYTNNTQAEQERTDWQRMRQQPTLFVHVLNEQSQLLQVEPLPRPPQLGQVDYLEIILEKKEEK